MDRPPLPQPVENTARVAWPPRRWPSVTRWLRTANFAETDGYKIDGALVGHVTTRSRDVAV